MSDEDVESRSTASGSPAPAATVPFPPDRFHLTYGVTFLAGVGTLLPWNVFITERAYFDLRLFVPPYAPAVADAFESVFGMTFMAANILGLALLVRGDALSRVPRLMRVPAPLLAMAVLLAASGALAGARETSGDATAGATLLTLLCLGGLTALVQGGSFADASCLPPKYNQALMGGQAAAGVASAAAALATTAAARRGGDDDETEEGHSDQKGVMTQASVYFYVSACVMLVCALGCAFAARLPFFERRVEAAAAAKKRDASGGRNPGAARVRARRRRTRKATARRTSRVSRARVSRARVSRAFLCWAARVSRERRWRCREASTTRPLRVPFRPPRFRAEPARVTASRRSRHSP